MNYPNYVKVSLQSSNELTDMAVKDWLRRVWTGSLRYRRAGYVPVRDGEAVKVSTGLE